MRLIPPLLQITTVILLTLAVLVSILLSTAASRGGGSVAIFRTLRAVGFDQRRARNIAMAAAAVLAIRLPSWSTYRLAGGADRVNELRQEVINCKGNENSRQRALDGLLAEESSTRTAVNALLERVVAGKATPEEQASVPNQEKALASFEARINAARSLVANAADDVLKAEKALLAEEKRISAEDASLAARPSGRVEVVEDQAAKWAKDPKRGYESHSDFMTDVMISNSTGHMDPRLKPLATQGSDEQQGASNPYGGFFVPTAVMPGVLSIGPELDPFEGRVTPIPMTAPSVKFNARVDKNHATSVSGGFRVYRRPETVDGTPSRAAYEQVTLTANEETGVAFATESVINDSPESFVAIITAGIADEYVAAAIQERVNGTGVGERQGYMVTPCKITIDKEANQAADTITVENIDKMASRCWRYGQSIYLANHTTRPSLRGLVRIVGTGGVPVPYFTQNTEGQEFLDGRPIFFTEFAPAIGDLGDLALIVPSQYLEGTYQSEQFAESMHVRFLANERAFRFYRRNDGQWWWRTALSPKNGLSLSPVVLLGAR